MILIINEMVSKLPVSKVNGLLLAMKEVKIELKTFERKNIRWLSFYENMIISQIKQTDRFYKDIKKHFLFLFIEMLKCNHYTSNWTVNFLIQYLLRITLHV